MRLKSNRAWQSQSLVLIKDRLRHKETCKRCKLFTHSYSIASQALTPSPSMARVPRMRGGLLVQPCACALVTDIFLLFSVTAYGSEEPHRFLRVALVRHWVWVPPWDPCAHNVRAHALAGRHSYIITLNWLMCIQTLARTHARAHAFSHTDVNWPSRVNTL